jgi:eukaryotic-like serine/threonine-protein kinase
VSPEALSPEARSFEARLLARWAEARREFERLVELETSAQDAELGRLAARDGELERLVHELLRRDREAGLAAAPVARPSVVSAVEDPRDRSTWSGTRIGEFRLVRLLGSGGMGSVYEAEQQEPARRVALKLLHPGLASGPARRRFEAESDILAQLSHPHIAKVYASGVERLGTGALSLELPWFAMELLDGAPDLLSWAQAQAADLGQRLLLFEQLCAAIDYAHGAGVMHRDLKASNVLVDQHGLVQVIDFGIARRLTGPDSRPGATTLAGELYGSLACMAPEQFSEGGAPVGVRADIYALGALLFELTTGSPPLELQGLSIEAAAARIREVAPKSARSLKPELPRELNWICQQALAKDPALRYATVAHLAADVERLRTGQAVLAGRPGSFYRLGKWAQRHRRALALTALVGVLGLYMTDRLARSSRKRLAAEQEASVQRVATDREAEGRSRLANLLNFAIRQARPGGALTSAQLAPVLEQLELAIEAGHGLGDEEVYGLRTALASFWMADGNPQRATGLVERNLDALTRSGRRLSQAGAECLRQAAVLAGLRGDLSAADGFIAEARRCPGRSGQSEDSLSAAIQDLGTLGMAQMAALAPHQALQSLGAALHLAEQVHGTPPEALESLRYNLHLSQLQSGQPALAEAGMQSLLPTAEALFGPSHPRRVDVLLVRAKALIELGRAQEGLDLLEAEEPAAQSAYANNPGRLSSYLGCLGLARYRLNPSDQNFAALADEQAQFMAQMGPAHSASLAAVMTIAELRLERGEFTQAEAELQSAYTACRESLGGEHVRTLELEGALLISQARQQVLSPGGVERLAWLRGELERRCGPQSERIRRLDRLAASAPPGDPDTGQE